MALLLYMFAGQKSEEGGRWDKGVDTFGGEGLGWGVGGDDFSLYRFFLKIYFCVDGGSSLLHMGLFQLQLVGSVVLLHGLSCFKAGGITPNQESNCCPLHCSVDSSPLDPQGSPLYRSLTVTLSEFDFTLTGPCFCPALFGLLTLGMSWLPS